MFLLFLLFSTVYIAVTFASVSVGDGGWFVSVAVPVYCFWSVVSVRATGDGSSSSSSGDGDGSSLSLLLLLLMCLSTVTADGSVYCSC